MAMDYAWHQQLIIVQLDLERAYDHVIWSGVSCHKWCWMVALPHKLPEHDIIYQRLDKRTWLTTITLHDSLALT